MGWDLNSPAVAAARRAYENLHPGNRAPFEADWREEAEEALDACEQALRRVESVPDLAPVVSYYGIDTDAYVVGLLAASVRGL